MKGDDLSKSVRNAIFRASKPWRAEKKKTRRKQRYLSPSAVKRLYGKHGELSIKAAAYQVMERAYMQASVNNTLPANARQVMYQARPLVLKITSGRIWAHAQDFTQKHLPNFMKENPALTAGWDVVYDDRGHIEEPHTDRRIGLGTLSVRGYTNDWMTKMPTLTLSSISLGVETSGPGNRFKFALFIEKEGFNALLERAQIRNRYDIAVMSTKGTSVTASRELLESLTAQGVTTLIAHDFDSWGFTICHTFHTSTDRYTFKCRPNIKCLGLRLADAQQMGLDGEADPKCKNNYQTRAKLRRGGATSEEIEFLVGGERVELNAMTSGQFIEWIETKLQEHGVEKVVPDEETLVATYKRASLVRHANEALATIQENWSGNGNIEVPADLATQIRERIIGTHLSWDEAIKEIETPKMP